MNYDEAKTKLDTGRKQDSKKLENNTWLIRHTEYIGVKLHDTEVVKLYPDHVELFSGGWYTPTTKDRINKYSPTYVSQAKNIWYIGEFLFYEGIKIDYDGKIISEQKSAKKVEKQNKEIKKKIKSYVALALAEVARGIDLPDGGDCWYCCFKDKDGKTWGDTADSDHLTQHFKDKYIVPSLIWNAVKEQGYRDPAFIIGYDPETRKSGSYGYPDSIGRALTRYLQRRLLVKP